MFKTIVNFLAVVPVIGDFIQWVRTKRIAFLKKRLKRKKQKIKKLKNRRK